MCWYVHVVSRKRSNNLLHSALMKSSTQIFDTVYSSNVAVVMTVKVTLSHHKTLYISIWIHIHMIQCFLSSNYTVIIIKICHMYMCVLCLKIAQNKESNRKCKKNSKNIKRCTFFTSTTITCYSIKQKITNDKNWSSCV